MLCNLFNLFSLSGVWVGCLFFMHLNDTVINMLLHKFLYIFRLFMKARLPDMKLLEQKS